MQSVHKHASFSGRRQTVGNLTHHNYDQNKTEASQTQSTSESYTRPAPAFPKPKVSVSRVTTFDKVIGVLAIFLVADIFVAYLVLRSLTPSQPWVLALREEGDKSQLYAYHWKKAIFTRLGESEGDWISSVHWATSNSLATNIIQKRYVGSWNGGEAILLPNSEKIFFTLKQNGHWWVNLADLKANFLVTLEENLEAEPFISIAPFQKLAAIGEPATPERMATLRVFSLDDATEVSRPVDNALDAKGVLSSNGELLLYTTTLTRTEVGTDTEDIYSTTLYVADTRGENKRTIYGFNHSTMQVPKNYFFDFTPDNQFIIYQTLENQLNRFDIEDQISTSVFTSTQSMLLIPTEIAPDGEHLGLLLVPQQNPSQGELHLVSLETGQSILLEETFQTGRVDGSVFLDNEQIMYSPSSDKHIIYNVSTNSKTTISAAGAMLAPPLLAEDLGLIAFVTSMGEETIFNFFSPTQKDFVPNLSFKVQARDVGSPVIPLDFDMEYLIFQGGDSIYIKDIYTKRPPTLISDNSFRYFSPHFTSHPRYLLYSAGSDNLTNIYYADLRNQQSKLLVENAWLLH
jgi:hypothetical protein